MRCEEFEQRIERLVDGESPGSDLDAHLEECRRCSASLELARRIDAALAAQPVAAPPSQFTAAVVGRTRSLRWQSEQRLDWWFNATVAAALAVIAVGIWGLMNVTGLAGVVVRTADLVETSVPVLYEQVRPQLSVYVPASMLVAGGLAIWWWLERAGRPPRPA